MTKPARFILTLLYNPLFAVLLYLLVPTQGHATTSNSQNYLQRFEDYNTLLLRPKVGALYYEDDIYTILKNGALYLSLEDVIDVLNLGIDYNRKTQTASGWFLREDWTIIIDLKSKSVTSRGENHSLLDEDILQENETFFIEKKNLETWFGFKFIPDIPQQYVEVISPYPLPIVARFSRQNKRLANDSRNEATLPRHQQSRRWLDINTADIQLGSRLRQQDIGRDDRISTIRNSSVIALQGQALKHDAYLLGSYNDTDGLASMTGRLSMRDENANLLGPLQARQYTLGDTQTVRIPLLGNTTQEFGTRITNKKPTNTQFQTTIIDGQAFPGWDVELYRNNILIDVQTVSTTGRYEFSDIALFGGDNNFEVFFYGPQGEIKKKEITVPVTASLLNTENSAYDLSVTYSDTQLYKNPDLRRDEGQALHFSGEYSQQIANGFGYAGLRSREVDDDHKTYMGAGFTGAYNNMIYDGNIGASIDGALSGQVQLRRAISGWDLITTAKAQTEDYAPNGEENPSVFQLSTSTQKGFKPTENTRLNIFSRGNLNKLSNDTFQSSSQIGATFQRRNFSLSNNLSYSNLKLNDGRSDKTLTNNVSARYNAEKYFLRGGINSILHPTREIDDYFAQATYRASNKLSGDVRITHKPLQGRTEGRLNLNYTNPYFRTSPFVEYNSDQDLFAGVNINFSLIDTPNDNGFDITSRRLSGKGLVSSFIYHDKNGNLKFDDGDEYLPDVIVESLNIRRREATNDNGYSLIKDLPTNRATDIMVDQDTLPDSFMMASNKGVSVLPNPGEIIELQFPIHLSGEIDGTISLKEGDRTAPIRRAKIELHPLQAIKDDIIEIETALDGFYVGANIPPGRYIMKISDHIARQYNAGAPAPQIIDIGFDGNIIYGLDLKLDTDIPHVPVNIKRQKIQTADFSNTEQKEIIAIKTNGNTQSKLAYLLGSYATEQASTDIFENLKPLPVLQDASFNNAGNTYLIAQDQEIQTTHAKCVDMLSNGIPCAMEIIVPEPSAQSF